VGEQDWIDEREVYDRFDNNTWKQQTLVTEYGSTEFELRIVGLIVIPWNSLGLELGIDNLLVFTDTRLFGITDARNFTTFCLRYQTAIRWSRMPNRS
jgi:hypothetical protein